MSQPVPSAFSCTCGKLRGHISPAGPKTGLHLVCHCRDCHAAQRYLGQSAHAQDGVDLFQTSPDTIKLETGIEHLAILRLSPKGPFRWYASCCNTPMFNTLSRPGLAFVTVLLATIANPEIFGPVRAQSFVPQPGGSPKHINGGRMVLGVLTRMVAARLSGRWKQTPFFDLETGKPIAPVHLIDREERKALYD